MMSRIQKGVIAGFAAAVVVAVLELANIYFGPWAASFPRLLSVMLQSPDTMAIGWAAHFVAGVGLGALFGVACPRLPTDTPETKGIVFAVGAFIVMGLTVAPLGGVGLFFMRAGFGTLAWMIVSHAIFGAVLGNVYARLAPNDWRIHHPREHHVMAP